MGSPPRVREKLCENLRRCRWHRITPACAGKTFRYDYSHRTYQDHPRVCGKNAVNVTPWFLRLGSPPRVREKQSAVLNSIDESRITPACAGKTIIKTVSITTSQDHPRVCGKNSPNVRANKRRSGSPPRVREKHNIARYS